MELERDTGCGECEWIYEETFTTWIVVCVGMKRNEMMVSP